MSVCVWREGRGGWGGVHKYNYIGLESSVCVCEREREREREGGGGRGGGRMRERERACTCILGFSSI